MGFENWRRRQGGNVSKGPHSLSRAMGVAAIPPQCPAVEKLIERTKEVIGIADDAITLAARSPRESALDCTTKNLFIDITGAGNGNALANAILSEYGQMQDAYNA